MFASPWNDMASKLMPVSHEDSLRLSEFVWMRHSTYRRAHERIISYFLTDVEVTAATKDKVLSDDDRGRWTQLLEDTLEARQVTKLLDEDRACYGNGFASIVTPFIRMLQCPRCAASFELVAASQAPRMALQWDASRFQFVGNCPSCASRGQSYRGVLQMTELIRDMSKELRIKRWSVHEIAIRSDIFTGHCQYYWKIPNDYRQLLKRGDIHAISKAPRQVLQAVHKDLDFQFAEDALYHMKEPTLSGIRTRGWGLSRTLTNFPDIFHVQVLRRYNEVLAMDYIVPFRVLCPDVRNNSGGTAGSELSDPFRTVNVDGFVTWAKRMVAEHRRDPASWHYSPYPTQYQVFGGEAKNLVPVDLIQMANEDLLNAIGTPQELYRGTMQLEVAPVSLRLFESSHQSLVYDNNQFLQWIIRQVAPLVSLPSVKAKYRRVTHADDFNKTMALLQLLMGGQISRTTGLRPLDVDFKEETRQLAEDARFEQEVQARVQEEMEQAAFGAQIAKGQPPGGDPAAQGAPAGPGGQMPAGDPAAAGGPVSPTSPTTTAPFPDPNASMDELQAYAQNMAQQLLRLPETQRKSELVSLKSKHSVLHALVTAELRQVRSQARSQGAAMILGQQPPQPQQ